MANHIHNRLTVTLDALGHESSIESFRLRAARVDPEYHKSVFTEAPEFPLQLSFWNFRRPGPAAREKYNDSSVGARDGWYDWNNRNWGTKWDAWDVSGIKGGVGRKLRLVYDFTTANATPLPVLEAMMAMFPYLNFELRWQDEGGPGGVITGVNGIWSETDRFNGATSHTEATESRRLVTCDCLLTGGAHTPFPDCPAALE